MRLLATYILPINYLPTHESLDITVPTISYSNLHHSYVIGDYQLDKANESQNKFTKFVKFLIKFHKIVNFHKGSTLALILLSLYDSNQIIPLKWELRQEVGLGAVTLYMQCLGCKIFQSYCALHAFFCDYVMKA